MAMIKVHGHPCSTATALVLCCLNEKQLQYELVLVELFVGAQKKPQYLALNPFGVVPTIQDGDLTLFESRAIIKYLAKKYQAEGTDLLGKTVSEQAMVDQWCEVEAQSFFPPAWSILIQMIKVPMQGGITDEAIVKRDMEKLEKLLDIYEQRLSTNKYLAGDFLSLADLQHLPCAEYLANSGGKGDLFFSRKHVNVWWEDISSRPSWRKAAMRKIDATI